MHLDEQREQLGLVERCEFLTDEAKLLIRPRADLLVRCEVDERLRVAVIKACREGHPDGTPGYVFFGNMFGWIHEPRNPTQFQKLPFIFYEYQLRELAVMWMALCAAQGILGDVFVKLWLKSRDMGLTWLVAFMFLYHWLFHQGLFHCGSRNEKEVDYLANTGTIFFKLRFLLYNLPLWMRMALCPDLEDKLLLLSYRNGEVSISGESANANFATGNRKTGILADEYSKWEHDKEAYRSMSQVSNCLFLVGTPIGLGNHYAEIITGKAKIEADIRRVHWMEHPLKSQGAELIEGMWTSPWYRKQCTKMEEEMIAGELDLQLEGSRKGMIYAALYGAGHRKSKLKPIPGSPIFRTWDLGGWSAILLWQIDRWGRWHWLKEVWTEGKPLSYTAEAVIEATEELSRRARAQMVIDVPAHYALEPDDCGDPAGMQLTKTNQEIPEYDYLRKNYQIDVNIETSLHIPAQLRVKARHAAVERLLKRYISSGSADIDGPAMWVDVDECPFLDDALRGGYRRVLDKDGNVTEKIESKRPYIDLADALGYGVIYQEGVPESFTRDQNKLSEEQIEDGESGDDGPPELRRSRC